MYTEVDSITQKNHIDNHSHFLCHFHQFVFFHSVSCLLDHPLVTQLTSWFLNNTSRMRPPKSLKVCGLWSLGRVKGRYISMAAATITLITNLLISKSTNPKTTYYRSGNRKIPQQTNPLFFIL